MQWRNQEQTWPCKTITHCLTWVNRRWPSKTTSSTTSTCSQSALKQILCIFWQGTLYVGNLTSVISEIPLYNRCTIWECYSCKLVLTSPIFCKFILLFSCGSFLYFPKFICLRNYFGKKTCAWVKFLWLNVSHPRSPTYSTS